MRRRGFIAGALAASTGIGLAHLLAAVLDPQSSPVLAVGAAVIDATPTPVKTWAIDQFGTADKPILIGSVLAAALVLAGLIGILAQHHRRRGQLLIGLLVLPVIGAVLTRPDVDALDLVPAILAVAVAPVVLGLLTAPPSRDQVEDRRAFLLAAGVAAALTVAAAGAGQFIIRTRALLSDIVLPPAAAPLPHLPTGLESQMPRISPFRTPVDDFYRVDTKLTVPLVDHTTWHLDIDGMVGEKLRWRYEDLLAMPLVERDITLTCVSNEVGGPYVGAARWLGVPLMSLLDRAGIEDGPDQVLSTDVDGFTISTPLDVIRDGRDALVAVGMNGGPLPREHGFPARLVVPGIYGFVGATKWLTRLTLTTYAEAEAYWTKRRWATEAPIQISSRIDTPRPFTSIEKGRQAIGGTAWSPHHGVARVQVQVDGSRWLDTELGPDAGIDYWRQWWFQWDATPGSHTLAVRAIGKDGTVQTAARRTPFPQGSTGVQQLSVTVS